MSPIHLFNVLFQLEGLCINYDGITLLDTLIIYHSFPMTE